MAEIIQVITLILILSLHLIVLYLQKDKILLMLKRPVSADEYVEDLEKKFGSVASYTEVTPLIDPFLKFPCDCKEQIILEERIFPGQAAVLLCENCKTSWTVYNPSLVVKKTSELPEELQEVWAKLEHEPF